jgi:uncharacterized protein YndB with AHSA1/START domain
LTPAKPSSSLGQVKVEGDYATLVFERRLHHPIDVVWQAITDPNELSKWYLPEAKIEGRSGGKVEFSFSGDAFGAGRVTGNILVWDPPYVFEHEWIVDRPGFQKGEFGVLRWELFREGDGTLLKLTHRNLPSQIARNFAPGVHAILDRLEGFLDKRSLPDWRKQVQELQSSYSQ